ncbi:hypothetical protein QN362_14485 [Actimicrobium sp. CCC2.4]|nr:hypothetical protein [Actimicrobium sp. CCC2.4]MEB0136544.1 hypothetical protein [Actimicrobium sp. CCC2.4]WPX31769.1 hypothetical protein RHM62_16255 [Actimicrobium sp. CCC2.4]
MNYLSNDGFPILKDKLSRGKCHSKAIDEYAGFLASGSWPGLLIGPR